MSRLDQLPSALDAWGQLADRFRGRTPAVFCDYDGTLSPIVDRPEDAVLSPAMRTVLERLGARCPVAIVSGRDLDDVHAMVGIDGLCYAGSHGFDLLLADGTRTQHGEEASDALGVAADLLAERLAPIEGARVERKRFAVAVHYRQVIETEVPTVQAAVEEVRHRLEGLRLTGGKKIWELRPDIDWDKGAALLHLLEVLGLDRPDVVPAYLGDDLTDEDAFRVLEGRGVGIVVRGEDDDRPTAADYALADTEEVRRLLERLVELLEPRP